MPSGPLATKPRIKPGDRLTVVNAPEGVRERLDPLPDGARIVDALEPGLDAVQLYVRGSDALACLGPVAFAAVSGKVGA